MEDVLSEDMDQKEKEFVFSFHEGMVLGKREDQDESWGGVLEETKDQIKFKEQNKGPSFNFTNSNVVVGIKEKGNIPSWDDIDVEIDMEEIGEKLKY